MDLVFLWCPRVLARFIKGFCCPFCFDLTLAVWPSSFTYPLTLPLSSTVVICTIGEAFHWTFNLTYSIFHFTFYSFWFFFRNYFDSILFILNCFLYLILWCVCVLSSLFQHILMSSSSSLDIAPCIVFSLNDTAEQLEQEYSCLLLNDEQL